MLTKLERLPTIGILGVAFGIWALGFFIISPTSNTGYLAFLQWEMISPTLITLLLHFRSVWREKSMKRRSQLHVAWLATLAVVVHLGNETWIGYHAMDDAPRGLLWDFYQFTALIYGSAIFCIGFALAYPFTGEKAPGEQGEDTNPPPLRS